MTLSKSESGGEVFQWTTGALPLSQLEDDWRRISEITGINGVEDFGL